MSRPFSGLFFSGTEILERFGHDEELPFDDEPESDHSVAESDADEDTPHQASQIGNGFQKRPRSPSVEPNGGSKRLRVQGGKAAVPKRIETNYDSDDGLIIQLKQQGYSDEFVANRLRAEGRTRYVPKTVGSRWLRLRKTFEADAEKKLDDELSDWHIGEDDALRESIKFVDKSFEREMQKINDKKWKAVSNNLALRLQKTKYTAKACRERFEGIENGTALKPFELDSDQEGRARMREARIEAAKQRRAREADELKRSRGEKARKIAEKRVRAAQKHKERVLAKKKKDEEQNEMRCIREEKRAGKRRSQQARDDNLAAFRRDREDAKKEKQAMSRAYFNLTGTRLFRKRRVGRSSKSHSDMDSEEEMDDDSEDAEPEMSDLHDDDSDDDRRSSSLSEADIDQAHIPAAITTTNPSRFTKSPVKLPQEGPPNPRSIMTASELDSLLYSRGLPRRGPMEAQPQLVARLAAADEQLKTPTLNALLRKYWDKGKGRKADKIHRLQQYDADESAARQEVARVSDARVKEEDGSEFQESADW